MEVLLDFVQDAFIDGAVVLIHLDPQDTQFLTHIIDKFGLDFDDAYQYVAAEKYDLTIVSFDRDFDHTERGKRTPAQVLL
jgi:predicted nucleic acid-binding protein